MFQPVCRSLCQNYYLNRLFVRFLTEAVVNEAKKCGPLSGVRILDLSCNVAGPFCTMLLGDLGAEVIKVENPKNGDKTRSFGPFLEDESLYFMAVNRNKKSIALDLKLPNGKEIIKQLVMKSDVLIENFKPGKMASFGLNYEELKRITPRLIYCSITGFGPTGPYSQRAGIDLVVASVGGQLHLTGPKDGDPCAAGVPLTDILTGMYAHGAIMAALLERDKSGTGQRIECDLLASQVSTLVYRALNYIIAGVEGERRGGGAETLVPYQVYKTKDSYISIAAITNKTLRNLCEVLKLPDLTVDSRFSSMGLRLQNREEMHTLLQDVFRTNTTDHWLKILDRSHVPYAPVHNMEGVFNDPQVVHKNIVQCVNHSKIGKVKMIKPAVTYSESSNKIRQPPPALGEHTDIVLKEILSYSSEKIQKLRKSKVFG